MIDVSSFPQNHIGEGASVLVEAVRLEDDFFSKDQRGRRLLGLMAVRLALLGAIDPAEADAFRMVIMQAIEVLLWRNGISASS
jgi:hypothetical protein